MKAKEDWNANYSAGCVIGSFIFCYGMLACHFYLAFCHFQDNDVKEESPGLNGVAGSVAAATAGIGELTFEDADEEDQFYSKDLPKHACS